MLLHGKQMYSQKSSLPLQIKYTRVDERHGRHRHMAQEVHKHNFERFHFWLGDRKRCSPLA